MSRREADQGKPRIAEFSRWPLAKCPWCGSRNVVVFRSEGDGDKGDWRVWCENPRCLSSGPVRQTELAARTAWQRGMKR